MAQKKVIEAEVETAESKPRRTKAWESWQVWEYCEDTGDWLCSYDGTTKAGAIELAKAIDGPACFVHIHIPAMDY